MRALHHHQASHTPYGYAHAGPRRQLDRHEKTVRRLEWSHGWLCRLAIALAVAGTSTCDAQSTGGAFGLARERSVSIARGDAQLLDVLQSLEQNQQVAILLDRRLDPEQIVSADLRRMRLQSLIGNLASQSNGGLSVVGDTFYVGPADTVRRLRTLIELRGNELRALESQLGKRIFELLHRKRVVWDDLAEPRLLVRDISDSYQLQVEGLELLPHDLWRGSVIAHPNAAESLLLVLMQFDLSFVWLPEASGIRIVPAPESAEVERLHEPRKTTAQLAMDIVRDTFPGVSAAVDGKQLRISCTVEEHESLEYLLGEKSPTAALPVRQPVVLANQRFTLRSRGQRVDLLFEALQLDGVRIEYDAAALDAAGIDLGTTLDLQLEQATTQALFTALCGPLNLEFTIRNNVVLLKPRAAATENEQAP